MSLHIVFVTLGYTPHRLSGLDVSGERLVDRLLAAGHKISVVAGSPTPLPETRQHPALKIYRIPLGRSNWIGFGVRAARRIKAIRQAEPVDVVHFWDVYFGYAYRGAYVASLQHSFRQRWSLWDRPQTSRLASGYRWAYYSLARILAEQPAAERATGLLAASLTARDEYIQQYGLAPNRIAVARHGIDIQQFQPRPPSDRMRVRYGLAPQEPVVLFVGFVTPRKGLDYLAQALPLIHPPARLLIAGRWSARYRARFLEMLGQAANRVIEAGFVPDEEMPDLYNLADVYVSPSLLEGFGLPLAEAMACETPVVAAEAGSVAEIVGPGGTLVPPRDFNALALAVTQLLSDRKLAQELGQRGRRHVVAHFSLDKMAHDTLAAYHRFTAIGSAFTDQSQISTPGLDDTPSGNED